MTIFDVLLVTIVALPDGNRRVENYDPETNDMTQRAIIYGRVSGDDRGKEGRNLAGQIQMGRVHATKRGYQVVAELSEDDRGASGAEINLPMLNKLREMARARQVDVLIVREIDRLSRNLAKQLIVESELRQHGVEIEYVLGDYPDTPEGNFMKHVRASVAEFEREKINERMIRGRRLKVERGSVLVAGHPPYGYDVANQNGKYILIINETEAVIVKQIFSWYVLEGLAIRVIAQKLDQLGVPTSANVISRRRAKAWGGTTVRKILTSETYCGRWHYGKGNYRKNILHPRASWLVVSVPRLIDDEDWDLAQQKIRENKARHARTTKHERLMQRRLICAKCGKTLYSNVERYKTKSKTYLYLYYVCNSGCKVSVNALRADAIVWEWLKSVLREPGKFQAGLSLFQKQQQELLLPLSEQVHTTEALIKTHRGQLDKLIDLYLSDVVSRDDLAARKAQLESTVSSLETTRDELMAQLKSRAWTDEEIDSIQTFMKGIKSRIQLADKDFGERKRLVQMFKVVGQVAIENDEPILHAKCIMSQKALRLKNPAICDRRLNKHHSRVRAG